MKRLFCVLGLFLCLSWAYTVNAAQQRYFQFTYTVTVTDVPTDAKKVQLWLPYPTSNSHQIIDDMRINSPYPIRITREPEYGNSILYVEANTPPKTSAFTVQMQFTVLRKEYISEESASQKLSQRLRQRLLLPDKLVPLGGPVAQLSAQTTQGKRATTEKSRAIYDYVTRTMSYDKSGTGWGNGDALYACDAKRGNCTDFHSLIIGMARVANIPGLFEIGFPIPKDQSAGEIGGYHCWAELYVDGKGWIPMDSSEASKHPETFDYFYGNLCENRIQFTKGRDIILQPSQAGPPINYFIYPYVEVDSKLHAGIVKKFSFRDLPTPAWAKNE